MPLALAAPSCAPPGPGATNDDTSEGTGPEDSDATGSSTTDETEGLDTGSSDSDPASSSGTGSSDTGEPACGNGIVEADETCDDEVESPTCDADCTEVVCGDMHVNAAAGEECDGIDLAGATCQTLGFGEGTLSCGDGCSYDTSGCANLPAVPVLTLSSSPIKQFDFEWAAAEGADFYRLEESIAPGEPFVQLGGDIVGESLSLTMPLHLRHQASYRLRACNDEGCSSSAPVGVTSTLAEAVGYVKASNPGWYDYFGLSMALSRDGNTLAVGAPYEDGGATGIDGDQSDEDAHAAGAVYVFVRDGAGAWSQAAYVKPSYTGHDAEFGSSVALSDDGNTLAVGAHFERSNATGIDGNQVDDSLLWAGAAYVFTRDGAGTWSQQAYIKASNTGDGDEFGTSVALSGDGNTLAVGAPLEGSNATGIDGDQANDSAQWAGAAYVFARSGMGAWSQQAYIKASNTDPQDLFGISVALSADGDTLAVGAFGEDGNATGIDGDQTNDSAPDAGAVYVLVRDGAGAWSHAAYVKASNTGLGDYFGMSVALSGDGSTLAVGARQEDGNATGIDGDQTNDMATDAGAVYVLARDGVGAWSQQAYVKASNPDAYDEFGTSVALSADGSTLAVGTPGESSNATGIGGDQANDSALDAGAVHVLVRDDMGAWSQASYVKAPNTDPEDYFGLGVALSGDAGTLVVTGPGDDSSATGIGGDQANEAIEASGAVYLY